MKLSLVIPVLLLLFLNDLDAQKTSHKKTIPPFDIELTGSGRLKATDIQKNNPVLIIYFDPTCEHCRIFTADLLKHYKELGNTQVIMISFTPVTQLLKFESDFSLFNYPNIMLGTEGETFIVQRFYNVQKFPFIALYDKKGILIAAHRELPTVKQLLQEIKKAV